MSIPEQQYFNHLNDKNHLQKSKQNVRMSGEKLQEAFKAATDTIQNLPKNGRIHF